MMIVFNLDFWWFGEVWLVFFFICIVFYGNSYKKNFLKLKKKFRVIGKWRVRVKLCFKLLRRGWWVYYLMIFVIILVFIVWLFFFSVNLRFCFNVILNINFMVKVVFFLGMINFFFLGRVMVVVIFFVLIYIWGW